MNIIRRYIRALLREQVELCPYPKAIFMAGGPGSGKSTVIGSLGLRQNMPIINPDDTYEASLKAAGIPLQRGDLVNDYKSIKARYKRAEDEGNSDLVSKLEPEYLALRAIMSQNMKLFAAARKAAKEEQVTRTCERQSFLVDGTAGDSRAILKQVKDLRSQGYDVAMIFVDVPLETSIARNKGRGARGGRGLHDDTVRKSWSAVDKNKKLYSDIFGRQFFYVDAAEGSFEDSIESIRPRVQSFLQGNR